MREPIETIIYRNSEIAIYQDDDPHDTPNDWDPESACIVYDHRDFCSIPVIHGYALDSGWNRTIFEHWIEGNKTVEFGGIRYWIFPVYLFSHSCQTLYLSRGDANKYEPTGFDTSFKGFALVSRQYRDQWSKEGALKIAGELIKAWSMFLHGEVYGYRSASGSCWGFYGNEGKKQMIEEAKSEIDFDCHQRLLKKIDKLKSFIRNKVPLDIRQRRLIRVD